ncbi:hypothetical protein ACERK3_06965 [Phycisphaerales bacterium AB-hyl4]|uniref:Immunity protein 53 of polymorphic toxin system n=1 Tax=Natronomicrosphaera hydrolytica TaxID=3242702 RepID=A0ABV4U365_9BACT
MQTINNWEVRFYGDPESPLPRFYLELVHQQSNLRVGGWLIRFDDGTVLDDYDESDLMLPMRMADDLLVNLLDYWWDDLTEGFWIEDALEWLIDPAYGSADDTQEVKGLIERAILFHSQ